MRSRRRSTRVVSLFSTRWFVSESENVACDLFCEQGPTSPARREPGAPRAGTIRIALALRSGRWAADHGRKCRRQPPRADGGAMWPWRAIIIIGPMGAMAMGGAARPRAAGGAVARRRRPCAAWRRERCARLLGSQLLELRAS